MALRLTLSSKLFRPAMSMSRSFGSSNEGDGKYGGSIREAGGAFSKREAAQEEQFFRKQQQEQLEMLKKHLKDEIDRHESLIKQHEDAIKASKQKIDQLTKDQSK